VKPLVSKIWGSHCGTAEDSEEDCLALKMKVLQSFKNQKLFTQKPQVISKKTWIFYFHHLRFHSLMTVITKTVVSLHTMPCSLVGRYNIWKEPTSFIFRVKNLLLWTQWQQVPSKHGTYILSYMISHPKRWQYSHIQPSTPKTMPLLDYLIRYLPLR